MTGEKGIDVSRRTFGRGLAQGLLAAFALFFFFVLLLDLAGRARRPIVVDIGPSTGRYGSGFLDSEETPPTTSRWTRADARFDIPLEVDASPVRFSVRAARYLDDPTLITVTVDGRSFTSFEQARGRQRITSVEAPLPKGPLNLGLASQDANLGMALDWISIEGARWRIPASEWTVWILPFGLLAALLLSGTPLPLATGITAVVVSVLAAVAAIDPFGFVHSVRDVALPAVGLTALSGLLFRGQTSVILAVTATVFLKGGFLFHPNYFYNDVRQNDRYVGALRSYEGSLMERSRKAQVDLGVGYPRIVAGKKYAFPYSPVFYLPFTALPGDRDIVVRAIKHVALFAAAFEVGLTFVLARTLLPSSAAVAAWLAFAFPILTSRMLYAMWSTMAGHALDLLVVVLAVRAVQRPEDRKASLLLALAVLSTYLTYVSSLFNTSAFLWGVALLSVRLRPRLILIWLASSIAVIFGLYRDFTLAFLTEILPGILAGPSRPGAATTGDPLGLSDAFSRIVLFAGYAFPLLALCGLFLLRRRQDPAALVLKAYALAFLGLVLLRGLSFGLFKDLKEIEFFGPGFAILSALTVASIDRGIARFLVAAGLVGTGIWMQYGYFERWSRLVLG